MCREGISRMRSPKPGRLGNETSPVSGRLKTLVHFIILGDAILLLRITGMKHLDAIFCVKTNKDEKT